MRILFYDRKEDDNSEMTISELIQKLELIRLEWGENCVVLLPQESYEDEGESLQWNASICNIEIDTSFPDKTEILLY